MKETSNNNWVNHSPSFECDNFNFEMMTYSPWSGHRLFAYDYVVNENPGCIVELGSFYGCSSFAFLQAVKDYHLQTSFFAVDTWEGDSFTEHDYQEDVFGAYKKIQDGCYNSQNAHMLRMTFDEAAERFKNGSIDLLHIDGSHTYEDVKHDFYTWEKKISKCGAVFFHDIAEDLLDGETLGSHTFWMELKKTFPYTFEFPFSFGLGVLFFDKEKYEQVVSQIDFKYYQQQANQAADQYKDIIRKQFFRVESDKKYIEDLKQQVAVAQRHLGKYKTAVQKKDTYIGDLEENVENLTSKCRAAEEEIKRINNEYKVNLSKYQASLRETKVDYERTLQDTIEKYNQTLKETEDNYEKTLQDNSADYEKDRSGLVAAYESRIQHTITQYEKDIKQKEDYIKELEVNIKQYDGLVKGKDTYIKKLENAVNGYQESEKQRNKYIVKLERQVKESIDSVHSLMSDIEHINAEYSVNIEKYKKSDQEKDKYIEELRETIQKYERTVTGKDSYIAELKDAIEKYKHNVDGKDVYATELKDTISKYKKSLDEKENYISELKLTIQKYSSTVEGKEKYISELLQTIEKLKVNVSGKDSYIEELQGNVANANSRTETSLRKIDEIQENYTRASQKADQLERELNTTRTELAVYRRKVTVTEKTLKDAMQNAQQDAEMILSLQTELRIVREQAELMKKRHGLFRSKPTR